MRIRLIFSTTSPKKGVPLELKLAIPPSRQHGFNEFVKAALAGNEEVMFSFETRTEGKIRDAGVRGTFKFHPVDQSPNSLGTGVPISKKIDIEQRATVRIVFSSRSPKEHVPIVLKFKVPPSKREGFSQFINQVLAGGSTVTIFFELITKGKREKSKVQGDFHLYLK